jgi:hypothetical protein
VHRYRSDWASWFLPRRPGGLRLPPESLAEPHPADLARLAELREAGSRLRLPHPVRCHLYFPTEKSARSAMEALSNEGYTPQVRAEAKDRWRVTGVITLVPTKGSLTHVREQLEALARTLDGEYAGWDSPVVY